ncbi:ZIP family metal transporter [Zunongwangia endophytica]|uniref:ZIP family metal transporter n=1 Tax=Zunongwangia endophytica TaxID=1808945 RepID=A0ABV8H8V2_9FLAO|nr:zinc transporter [Zunongwangia endophytica]MDN3595831.1 zinc transporter [Zunongwangia endophytica]
MTIIVVLVVSFALILGAVWGIYGNLSDKLEGFLVALAGGALIVSAIIELIDPATKEASLALALAFVFAGASVFVFLDYLVKKKWGANGGGGLLAAITLDGIPENLALGVALIGAGPMQVAALAGSIFLSNLPEAAGGAKGMVENGRSTKSVLILWAGTAFILALAAILGNYFLADVSNDILSYIRCFAGGAVVASLATEVFPKAFKKDDYFAGLATALGLILAFLLNSLKK